MTKILTKADLEQQIASDQRQFDDLQLRYNQLKANMDEADEKIASLTQNLSRLKISRIDLSRELSNQKSVAETLERILTESVMR